MSEDTSDVDVKPVISNLTPAQKAMIERNRQRALEIRRAKLMPHPYAKVYVLPAFFMYLLSLVCWLLCVFNVLILSEFRDKTTAEKTIIRSKSTKVVDTGGGFLLEETDDPNKKDGNVSPFDDKLLLLCAIFVLVFYVMPFQGEVAQDPGPILPPDCPVCEECQKEFSDSYLLKSFNHSVCDGCR